MSAPAFFQQPESYGRMKPILSKQLSGVPVQTYKSSKSNSPPAARPAICNSRLAQIDQHDLILSRYCSKRTKQHRALSTEHNIPTAKHNTSVSTKTLTLVLDAVLEHTPEERTKEERYTQ